jgi:hypothetical protein
MKAITVKYFGPSNVRGSRYKATAEGGNTLTLHCDNALSPQQNKDAAARKLCQKMGWTQHPLYSGGLPNGDEVYVMADDHCRVEVAA